jgi:hypothetical protein
VPPKEKEKIVLRNNQQYVPNHWLEKRRAAGVDGIDGPTGITALSVVSEASGSNPAWVITGDYAGPHGTRTLWTFRGGSRDRARACQRRTDALPPNWT